MVTFRQQFIWCVFFLNLQPLAELLRKGCTLNHNKWPHVVRWVGFLSEWLYSTLMPFLLVQSPHSTRTCVCFTLPSFFFLSYRLRTVVVQLHKVQHERLSVENKKQCWNKWLVRFPVAYLVERCACVAHRFDSWRGARVLLLYPDRAGHSKWTWENIFV